ncbi:MAG TPA: dihydrofolate reductase family protein [Gemmatimonadaceae bacterium]|jgi:dihydrofolate reductase|nr:dihydrofolate reductase family protein [Gemmatimonadaceae bacterium]
MRTVTYGAACSLDGFIAPPDGSMDWLHFSRDVQDIMAKYWATVDTMLMGRKTWEVAIANASAGGDAGMGGVTTYVFSRTLRSVGNGAHLVSDDPGEFVRQLKQQPGKGICVMGGGELAQSLFEAGVIDEVGLNVHPIILGSGVPFFRDPGRRIALRLTEARIIDGGCVLMNYRVNGAKSKQARGRAASAATGAS